MKKRKRLLWQIYLSYVLITLLSLVAVTWYSSRSFKQFYLTETGKNLKTRAYLTVKLVAGKFSPSDWPQVNALCKKISSEIFTRLTILLPSGMVIGDSEEDPGLMDNHADRPEIKKALAGMVGISIRYSPTLKQEMMYTAIPVYKDGQIEGVVRTSMPVTAIDKTLNTIYFRIALGGLVVILFAAGISLIVTHYINKPIEEMRKGADRFAKGDLEYRLPVPDCEEIAGLAEAMNQMAGQLHERIRTVTQQRNELEAVLSSMVEAVLVVDTQEHIIRVNKAAARLFDLELAKAQGRSVQEMIRNTDLQHFMAKTLSSADPVEDDIILHDGKDRFLQAHGTMLYDAQGSGLAALIVLNDITRLKKLENMRREFVANVSHELKTPITSIKGFVETLNNGALSDTRNAKRFLDIVSRHADRLNAIIDDLLCLSRIEQEAENEAMHLEKYHLKQVLDDAVFTCDKKATEKKVKIILFCEDNATARINPALLEQAVVNLIDNAIKYSEPGSLVRIEGGKTENEAYIKIHDQGCGIPKEHIPRIFERFYRVDKARSRKPGGTGLGLAIVKHILHAHGGRISVDSTLNKGTIFSLYLPII